ncbi:serine/threonine-protein kinase [Nocardia tenerifensis]|uniref:serine/threonine-protein kinase n=1 Tax=Nocardia tenerifensis TaxID=228006 RepID=UPI00030548B4|nr:serine/threonine-protein kinase [Nocardia tenerifensis]
MVQLGVNESFADYLIEGVLGQGGMGTVYLAQHPRLPRRVALKLLNREVSADQELRRRFEQEANVVARLDHPGIVGIHDRGAHDGRLWIAMQYIHGSDAARLDPREVPVDRALRIVAETGAALDYAHSRGVLHRDIKPANILLAAPDTGRAERAVLTDFGIARLLDSNTQLTSSGTFHATLAYASPEQLSGEVVDHRSDQYSLACTLFTLLAGHPPFAATNPGQVVAGHISKPVPRLHAVRPDASEALDAVIARAMAKRPDDRFRSCHEFTSAAWESRHARVIHAPVRTPARLAPTAVNQPGRQAPTPVVDAARQGPTPTLNAQSAQLGPAPAPNAQPGRQAPTPAPNAQSARHGSTPTPNAQSPRQAPTPAPDGQPGWQGSTPAPNAQPPRQGSTPAPNAQPERATARGLGGAMGASFFAFLLAGLAALGVALPRADTLRALINMQDPHIAPYTLSCVAASGATLLLLLGVLLLLSRRRSGRAMTVLGCVSYLASLVPVRFGYDGPVGTTGGALALGLLLAGLTLLLTLSTSTARWVRANRR